MCISAFFLYKNLHNTHTHFLTINLGMCDETHRKKEYVK